ncbi:medium-chain acyl-CoA ligase ACSF2, mitochondrial-like [Uloborus diversus]|uniref:medium-chain acyl-CoA ligase ACSF2, mitochondrial-like n=1 Tax=Uloborus diversus TaxID=327109 RepID=UPI00240A51A5|nr:medium-chain acyl-CoA ligase ACSF2, mitochondrial-like [Uloborus diversus]
MGKKDRGMKISDVQKKIKNSYIFKHGDVVLSSSTMGQLVDKAADENGDHIAFISAHQGISKTFSEFRSDVSKVASGLVSLGLTKGDRVAIYCPNCYEWPLVQFATAKAGLILVNINPAQQASELEYSLKKAGCKALIMWDKLKTQDFYEILLQIVPELSTSYPGKLKSQNIPTLESVIMVATETKDGIIRMDDLMNLGNNESDKLLDALEKSVQFDDPINIQFTSGTTGKPKGATLSQHNIINNALVSARSLGHNLLKPVVCCQVPLFHCFGNVLGTLGSVIFQNTCVFPYAGFNAAATLETIEKFKCTTVYGTPTMYVDLINNYRMQNCNIKSLRHVVLGGASATESLIRDVRNVLKVPYISVAYGCTENSPATAVSYLNDTFENIVKSVMQPLEFVEMKIINDAGCLVPVNTQGELCTRGHVLFVGYWDDKDKTEEAIDKTRWFHTGDLCVMNEYGYIQIVGRKKDMVVRGGENLYPAEIENFLATHPDILEVHIVGLPDERMGEELCAWIALKGDKTMTKEEVKEFCKGKISHFKIPRYIEFVTEFPKTTSGKIQKFKMREISIKKFNL